MTKQTQMYLLTANLALSLFGHAKSCGGPSRRDKLPMNYQCPTSTSWQLMWDSRSISQNEF